MNEMNEKKLYIWRLAKFLRHNNKTMSADELATHLNRNKFLTSYQVEYSGGRGTYTLIRETWKWIHDELGLEDEADAVALAYVKADGTYAYE